MAKELTERELLEKLSAYNTRLKVELSAYKTTLKSIRTYCKNNMSGQTIGGYRMLYGEIENCFLHTEAKIRELDNG